MRRGRRWSAAAGEVMATESSILGETTGQPKYLVHSVAIVLTHLLIRLCSREGSVTGVHPSKTATAQITDHNRPRHSQRTYYAHPANSNPQPRRLATSC